MLREKINYNSRLLYNIFYAIVNYVKSNEGS
jgi:hypothetical protein